MEQAVQLALERNHDVIAAKLDLKSAEYDRVQARIYPNPQLSYTVGNIVLGPANPQGTPAVVVDPGAFGQTVHSVGVSEVIDVWAKRSARIRAADRSIEHRRLLLEDALREVVYAVRSAFAEVLREQSERDLAVETRRRYDETVRLSRARFAAGDISDSELKKVELEGLRYQNAEIDAQLQLDLQRERLAQLLAMPDVGVLPSPLVEEPDTKRAPFDLKQLVDRALDGRPDVRAAKQAKLVTEAALQQARREAYPDISLGVTFTHSEFTVSGDNPNALALTLSLPLPIFDRNQANVGRAQVDRERADNEARKLVLAVEHEVAGAVRKALRSDQLLDAFEGGMLERADSALRVAERSYRAGAISLLELLEAQRTYLDTRAQYLHALHEYRQAVIDVRHAVAEGDHT